jgi:hypothetical protein
MHPRFSLLLSGALLALSLQASAHHGWSGQETRQTEITGTVQEGVSLAGPHATMRIVDESGQVWDVTLAPPARTKRAGLAEDSIPVGGKVTILGNRNSDPDRFEIKTVRVTYDGKNYDVYPDRVS